MIGTTNISKYITEEDINDWATGANKFALDSFAVKLIQHAKRKESPDSEDDFVEMDVKTKRYRVQIERNHFQFVFSGLRRII